MSNTTPFYTTADVAAKTRASLSTIYRMMKRGDFPQNIKIGLRKVVWNKAEIDNWINKQVYLKNLKDAGL